MGIAGERRRRRQLTFVVAAGLGGLLALGASGGRDPSPPPPLPGRPPVGRDDVRLEVDAERHGGGVRFAAEVAVDGGGDPLTVAAWDDDSIVGERLPHGQVVLHVGLVAAGPPELGGVYTYAPPTAPAPALVRPGRSRVATATFDGAGPVVAGIAGADGDDVRRLDEVRVCVWSLRDRDGPAACADAAL